VREVPGLQGAVARDLDDLSIFENPDPRGPCGAPAPSLPAPAAGRGFQAAQVLAFELLAVDTEEAAAYLDALQADARPGCPGYESETNVGGTQRVGDIAFVDVAGVGDAAIAWTLRIEAPGGQVFGGVGAVRRAGTVAFVQVQGTEPVTGETVAALVRAAGARLDAGQK
jgi:hypothetical protein